MTCTMLRWSFLFVIPSEFRYSLTKRGAAPFARDHIRADDVSLSPSLDDAHSITRGRKFSALGSLQCRSTLEVVRLLRAVDDVGCQDC